MTPCWDFKIWRKYYTVVIHYMIFFFVVTLLSLQCFTTLFSLKATQDLEEIADTQVIYAMEYKAWEKLKLQNNPENN